MLGEYVSLLESCVFTWPCTAFLSFLRACVTCPKAAQGARNRAWAIVSSV